MLDNQIFILLGQVINSGMAAIGQGSIKLQQKYQPTQEGTPSAPTIFLYKIGPDQRLGTPNREGAQGFGAAGFTGSITKNILTVTSLNIGALALNQLVSGAALPSNLLITGYGSGSGEIGTYVLNQSLPTPISTQIMSAAGTWVYTETQQYISTFQASALATQNPADATQLTASDILNFCAAVLQSQSAIDSFEAQGVGILNISQIRNPYFSDDRERYEASPSMDFTLSHKQQIITTTPIISETEFQILRV